ncbi:SDR family oxidoreductase [Kitasatospora sp. NA04385]|uniref:SDR family oxidoreductase n=1 Tax=Kitasatospora sp. NA04385 TaxID=2742135 RepID=UPI0015919249|nr:SDR family oxidoreductase [Kitasatospora sp. NA04385]QKW20276.1 SDR family oxidoreductase [Kitasatospora sp. NA04385]
MVKTAVVTGASSGIGAAVTARLAKQGYRVLAVARRADRLAELAGRTGAEPHVLDVTDAGAVDRFAAAVARCDVLVNNAGGAFDAAALQDADPQVWRHSFEVNVLGTLHVTRALLPALLAAPGATVVTMNSTAGFTPYEGGGSYTAAKHAAHALTGTLRLELAGRPVRVVEIAPGMVRTEEFALNRFAGDADRAAAVYADVDRPLTAEDVAECVAFTVGLPIHVNVDQLVVRPLAQAAQHKLHRGPLFQEEAPR